MYAGDTQQAVVAHMVRALETAASSVLQHAGQRVGRFAGEFVASGATSAGLEG